MPCRAWWSDRRAAGEYTGHHRQWPARGLLHRWRTWTGCDARGRRQGCGGYGMKDFTPNIPDIVAEVRELFERYEGALEAKDVDAGCDLMERPHTIRCALNENGYGFEAIHKHRVARFAAHVSTVSKKSFSRTRQRMTTEVGNASAVAAIGGIAADWNGPAIPGSWLRRHSCHRRKSRHHSCARRRLA